MRTNTHQTTNQQNKSADPLFNPHQPVEKQSAAHTYKAPKSQAPFNFGSTPLFSPSPIILQPKLTINAPGDRYEQEADRIAEQVMRMPQVDAPTQDGNEAKVSRKPLVSQISPVIQRMPESVEDEEEDLIQTKLMPDIQRKYTECGDKGEEEEKGELLQTKPMPHIQRKCAKCQKEEEEKKQIVQTKSAGASPRAASTSLTSRIQSSRGHGKAMDAATNSFMSSRFGTDFSRVRIHADSSAAEMSQEINAQAFTVGRDVYFNRGKFSPGTEEGKRLLAHELTHVVQQGGVNKKASSSSGVASAKTSESKIEKRSTAKPLNVVQLKGISIQRVPDMTKPQFQAKVLRRTSLYEDQNKTVFKGKLVENKKITVYEANKGSWDRGDRKTGWFFVKGEAMLPTGHGEAVVENNRAIQTGWAIGKHLKQQFDDKILKKFIKAIKQKKWQKAIKTLVNQHEPFIVDALKTIRKYSILRKLQKARKIVVRSLKEREKYNESKASLEIIKNAISNRKFEIYKEAVFTRVISAIMGDNKKRWRKVALALTEVAMSREKINQALTASENSTKTLKENKEEKIDLLNHIKTGLERVLINKRSKDEKRETKAFKKFKKRYNKVMEVLEWRLNFHRGRGKKPPWQKKETTSIEITGKYSGGYKVYEGKRHIMLQINQAGEYFFGWMQFHEMVSGKMTIKKNSITGLLTGEEKDSISFDYKRKGSFGLLTLHKKGKLTLKDDKLGEIKFNRTSTRPTLSNKTIKSFPDEVEWFLYAAEKEPLDEEQTEKIKSELKLIKQLIQNYHESPHSIGAAFINDELKRFRNNFTLNQFFLYRKLFVAALDADSFKISKDEEITYKTGLELITLRFPKITPQIKVLLGRPVVDKRKKQYHYQYKILVVGGNVDVIAGVGIYSGGIFIKRTDVKPPEEFTLGIAFTEITAGASLGIHVFKVDTDWIDFALADPWERRNFIGGFQSLGWSIGGALGPGFSVGSSVTFFEGDGKYPPFEVSGDDFKFTFGLGGGIEAGMTIGYLAKSEKKAREKVKEQVKKRTSKISTSKKLHFEVDGSNLTDEGKQIIREWVAINLAEFDSPQSTLSVEGFTSTTAAIDYNEKLSWERAHNTLTFIRNILGDRFKIVNPEIKGHGEVKARESGAKDDTEDKAWRKVSINLNGKIVLHLFG